MEIEKGIAFKIDQQFPALYREQGADMVELVREYYNWLEETQNQSHYNSRRLFEYKDIAETVSQFLIYFHKKFMADLPLLEDKALRVALKNIMGLYRRKGTPGGIELFFTLFYQEVVDVVLPAKYMLKVSSSDWRQGSYLQLFANDNLFKDKDGGEYTYSDLIGKNIRGSISEARAAVDKVNLVIINKTLTPIIYISDVRGTFTKYDDIISAIGGKEINFGRLNGSASSLDVDGQFGGTTGNEVGDIYDIESEYGTGGQAIVTELFTEYTGRVSYDIIDGGFGYSRAHTKLLVSDQIIVIDNPNSTFVLRERLRDEANNQGFVTGQNDFSVGVKMQANNDFVANTTFQSQIRAIDRVGTPLITDLLSANVSLISEKNDTSPGPLFPDVGGTSSVKVDEMDNIEIVSLIFDRISDYLLVPINASNYNDPPAVQPMSGTADPVTLATPLDEAFDLTPFEIGTIVNFANINPGADYINDVFALARDDVMAAFDRYEQFIILDNISAAMSVGDEISQATTGVTGKITEVNQSGSFLRVRPFSYYGFRNGYDIIHKGNTYGLAYVARDYDSSRLGESAIVDAETQFGEGRIKSADIYDSGLGYITGENVYLVGDDGTRHAKAEMTADTQGITSGFWSSFVSHLNGYEKTAAADGSDLYFDSGMKIQDSDFYQEYSYQVKSIIDKTLWEEPIKNSVHLAGTKIFGDFKYEKVINKGNLKFKFNRNLKEDDVVGGAPIVGPDQEVLAFGAGLRVDTRRYSVDTRLLSADMTEEP